MKRKNSCCTKDVAWKLEGEDEDEEKEGNWSLGWGVKGEKLEGVVLFSERGNLFYFLIVCSDNFELMP